MKRYLIPIILIITIANLFFFMSGRRRYSKDIDSLIKSMKENAEQLATRNIVKTKLNLLKNENGNFVDEIQGNSKTLVVLLDPTGCGSCLDENVLWNRISENELVKVLVIMNHDNYAESLEYLKNTDIKPQVYLDSNYFSIETLKPQQLPVKLIVDKDGEVLLVDYVKQTEEEMNLFELALEKVLQ